MERADFGEWRRESGFCEGSCHLVEGSSRGGQVRTKGVALRKREERGSAAEGWERMKKGPEYEVKCSEVALRVKVHRGLNL